MESRDAGGRSGWHYRTQRRQAPGTASTHGPCLSRHRPFAALFLLDSVDPVIFHNLRLGHNARGMDAITPQIAMYLLASAFLGGAVVWLILGARSRRRLEQHADDWQGNVDDVVRARDRLIVEAETLRATIESQQGAVTRHEQAAVRIRTELASAREKEKQLSKDLFTLRGEREETKGKMNA